MHFKKRYFLLFAVFLTIVIFSAGCTDTATPGTEVVSSPEITSTTSIPNIVGVWTGTSIEHSKDNGFRDSDSKWWNVTEQNGLAFTGYKVYTISDGTEIQENFSGVMSYDGETIYIADHDNGFIFGEFIGPDEVELRLLNDGEGATAMTFHLTREEN